MRGAFESFQDDAAARLGVLRDALDKAREHVEGAEATVRRIARSLARTANEHGLSDLERRADNLADASTRRKMFARGRSLLEAVEAGPSGPQRTRILVVEDDPTSALLLESLLAADDRAVQCVDTALGALEALDDDPADLILLDLVLPDADGRDFLLRLRERPASAETPVVVMSARPASEARAECLALGAQDYLEKPADPAATRAVVAAQLARPAAGPVTGSRKGFADRAALARAFEAALARAAAGEIRLPALASLALERAGARPDGGSPGSDLWEASAPLRAVLRDGDVIAESRGGTMVALFVDARPDDVKERLESIDPPKIGLTAGVAAVASGASLGDAIARSDRMLSLARAPDMPRILASEPEGGGRAARVLLVEDDPVTATLVNHRLTKDGFEVERFEDGEEALKAARGGAFDVGVFDVKLGGMDGFELLQRVRALDHFRGVPILMLTAMGREADIVRGFELGADDYVLKPFSPVELVARIHRLLDA